MKDHVVDIERVIDYIEEHLDGKLNLDTVAKAVHYSKFHLHRKFTATVGMTIHDYAVRRRLTEGAKLLVFSDKPIIDVAMICGYESQQSFSTAFKAMYKTSPAECREKGSFYPLQLRFLLQGGIEKKTFSVSDITLAKRNDVDAWMQLMRLVIDGYPVMDENEYLTEILKFIQRGEALVLKDGEMLIGAMAFSGSSGNIEFFGVHPQWRNCGIQRLFLEALTERFIPGREISITTYRAGDKADTGYRDQLIQLGFAERELLVEFGYPTQRFVLPPKHKEDSFDANSE